MNLLLKLFNVHEYIRTPRMGSLSLTVSIDEHIRLRWRMALAGDELNMYEGDTFREVMRSFEYGPLGERLIDWSPIWDGQEIQECEDRLLRLFSSSPPQFHRNATHRLLIEELGGWEDKIVRYHITSQHPEIPSYLVRRAISSDEMFLVILDYLQNEILHSLTTSSTVDEREINRLYRETETRMLTIGDRLGDYIGPSIHVRKILDQWYVGIAVGLEESPLVFAQNTNINTAFVDVLRDYLWSDVTPDASTFGVYCSRVFNGAHQRYRGIAEMGDNPQQRTYVEVILGRANGEYRATFHAKDGNQDLSKISINHPRAMHALDRLRMAVEYERDYIL